jgi:hypothetical protein
MGYNPTLCKFQFKKGVFYIIINQMLAVFSYINLLVPFSFAELVNSVQGGLSFSLFS